MKHDYMSQARVMTATAKCMEAVGPLSAVERERVLFGLIIQTLDETEPKHKKLIEDLLSKMTEEMKR